MKKNQPSSSLRQRRAILGFTWPKACDSVANKLPIIESGLGIMLGGCLLTGTAGIAFDWPVYTHSDVLWKVSSLIAYLAPMWSSVALWRAIRQWKGAAEFSTHVHSAIISVLTVSILFFTLGTVMYQLLDNAVSIMDLPRPIAFLMETGGLLLATLTIPFCALALGASLWDRTASTHSWKRIQSIGSQILLMACIAVGFVWSTGIWSRDPRAPIHTQADIHRLFASSLTAAVERGAVEERCVRLGFEHIEVVPDRDPGGTIPPGTKHLKELGCRLLHTHDQQRVVSALSATFSLDHDTFLTGWFGFDKHDRLIDIHVAATTIIM